MSTDPTGEPPTHPSPGDASAALSPGASSELAEETLRAQARAAYERGRARTSLVRALVVTAAVSVLSVVVRGPASLPFAGLLLAAIFLAEWRGELLGQGARRGAALGLASWLVPMTVLRPCCVNMAERAAQASCCTMPECCLAAGACLGLLFSLAAPRGRRGDLWGAVGLAGGALGVTTLRCSGLFAGEALGLLGGIALGALVAGGARVALTRAPA